MTAPAPTPECRCRQCGAEKPMGCGQLCADCSWEDHLAGMAHTGPNTDPDREDTPECCKASRVAELEELAHDVA